MQSHLQVRDVFLPLSWYVIAARSTSPLSQLGLAHLQYRFIRSRKLLDVMTTLTVFVTNSFVVSNCGFHFYSL